MIIRKKTKTVKIGSVKVGGGHPISIQSMAKTDTGDVLSTVRQIKALEKAGCEIIRVAVKNAAAAGALAKIKAKISIPLVADIHFNYRLALKALDSGLDGLRLNPGNIYRQDEVRQIAKVAKKRKVPIRVGVNSGSLPSYAKASPYAKASGDRSEGRRTMNYELRTTKLADLMVKSALTYIKMLENLDFYDIIVSLKASSVAETVLAYRKLSRRCNYPFHLGVTAAGLPEQGIVKSAIGIGALLLEGIGDTIRVSLAGDPAEEVRVAKDILQPLGLRYFGPELIVCPTCGRCQTDVVKIAKQLQQKIRNSKFPPTPRLRRTGEIRNLKPLKVAVMGCEVNGPGEAREADIGVACGKNSAVLFKKGKMIKKITGKNIVKEIKNALE